jgi:hypothetical protein
LFILIADDAQSLTVAAMSDMEGDLSLAEVNDDRGMC